VQQPRRRNAPAIEHGRHRVRAHQRGRDIDALRLQQDAQTTGGQAASHALLCRRRVEKTCLDAHTLFKEQPGQGGRSGFAEVHRCEVRQHRPLRDQVEAFVGIPDNSQQRADPDRHGGHGGTHRAQAPRDVVGLQTFFPVGTAHV
jgi:hypothetical protein